MSEPAPVSCLREVLQAWEDAQRQLELYPPDEAFKAVPFEETVFAACGLTKDQVYPQHDLHWVRHALVCEGKIDLKMTWDEAYEYAAAQLADTAAAGTPRTMRESHGLVEVRIRGPRPRKRK